MSTEIVPRAQPLLPMDIDSAEQQMIQYQELTARLLKADDWQGLPGQRGAFVKRSGWAKISTFYGVSTEVLRYELDRDENDKLLRAHVTVRASAPNGRHADGDGGCSVDEPRFASRGGRQKVEHDLPATATTRATNRAISNLVGFGQVSAEEMSADGSPAALPPTGSPRCPTHGWTKPATCCATCSTEPAPGPGRPRRSDRERPVRVLRRQLPCLLRPADPDALAGHHHDRTPGPRHGRRRHAGRGGARRPRGGTAMSFAQRWKQAGADDIEEFDPPDGNYTVTVAAAKAWQAPDGREFSKVTLRVDRGRARRPPLRRLHHHLERGRTEGREAQPVRLRPRRRPHRGPRGPRGDGRRACRQRRRRVGRPQRPGYIERQRPRRPPDAMASPTSSRT